MNLKEKFVIQEYKKAKDYVKSPFRYPGGKFYALKYIIPFLECVEYEEYREPFIGGGSVFFGKEKSAYTWINDSEPELINVYKVMQDEKKNLELIKKVTSETASKERHLFVKNLVGLNSDVERAYRTYYLNRTSFSGILNNPAWGYAEGKSSPPENWGNFLIKSSEKLRDVKITNLDFSEVISAESGNRKVLMYLDPPYYLADQKRAYTNSFEVEDHKRLAKLLRETKFYFCLSYDDCQEVRDLYSWANIYEQTWLYNTANLKNEKRSQGKELIITNYEVILDKQIKLDI